MCGKCGAVERALCGGCNGGLYCLWKGIEMECVGNVERWNVLCVEDVMTHCIAYGMTVHQVGC
jgi:hypothetical protein